MVSRRALDVGGPRGARGVGSIAVRQRLQHDIHESVQGSQISQRGSCFGLAQAGRISNLEEKGAGLRQTERCHSPMAAMAQLDTPELVMLLRTPVTYRHW